MTHAALKGQPQESPFLTIHQTPIVFEQDWATGIGGGLWSTGLAMARYFETQHAVDSLLQLKQPLSVLELGSGNGFLAVCFLALARSGHVDLQNVVVTDRDEQHLEMIQQTLTANSHLMDTKETNVHVLQHEWGEFTDEADTPDAATLLPQAVCSGSHKFDLILGTDVAYHPTLYDPLIASLSQFSHETTVTLLGVTMTDTKPEFFHLLERAGFLYEKLSDHLLPVEFRGTTFGIFVVQKKKKT